MGKAASRIQIDVPEKGGIPPLQNGDRLSCEEFERRYDAMPEVKKAELIEGIVYVPSPAHFKHHSIPQSHLNYWLCHYVAKTQGVEGSVSGTIRMDKKNEPQPDGFLLIMPNYGGQARLSNDDYLEGAPELVAEVSASSTSYDLNVKREVFRRNKVCEYLVWRVYDQAIDWLVLREGRFELMTPGDDGILRSQVFPGLWLDAPALIRGDLIRSIEVLEMGLRSFEHGAFVKRLAKAAAQIIAASHKSHSK